MRRTAFLGLALALNACSSSTTAPPTTEPDASRPADAGKDTAVGTDTSVTDSAGCAASELRCGGKCVDVTSDSANCGACGKSCGEGGTCVGGACSCDASKKFCGGACVDTNTTDAHCGACDNACPGTQKCSEGKCQTPCGTGESRCMGSCINTTSDPNNCGACGTKCDTDQSCAAGKCTCDFPTKLCGGKCINVNFDANNCGDCGKVCPSGTGGIAGCTGGSCVLTCKTGFGNCNDLTSDGCEAEYAVDNNNCGACGVKCPTLTSVCQAGACKTCPSGTILCSGACVGNADPKNCGTCGNMCSGSTPNCSAGSCVATCPSGKTACAGSCIDTTTDPNNCGTCGNKCSTGACVASACLLCTTGTITKDIPFGSVTGWTTSGCCTQSNYLVANGSGATVSATFADEIPAGSVVKTVTVKWGVEHACESTVTNAMDFQLNGTSIGTWNSAKGPDCACGDTRVGDATFTAPNSAYRAGMTNTVSIVHNATGSCHEAITNAVGAPTGTAARVVITYGCP